MLRKKMNILIIKLEIRNIFRINGERFREMKEMLPRVYKNSGSECGESRHLDWNDY